MNDLKLFNFENHEVRTLLMNGEPYFVGKDVADTLGYQNGSRDINRHVDEEDRLKTMVFDGNQNKETIVINESGVYALIFGSKLPNAKKFKHWVTSEVLPQIRKTGNYKMPRTYAEALRELADQTEKNEALRLENKEMKPKAIFADAVNDSNTDILIGDLAKLIKQNGHDIGQKRLFEWMRNNGYLMKSGSSKNLPTQKAMILGLFRIKERTINNPDGSIRITKTTKVTGKGQIYFVNKFIKESEYE